MYRQGLGDCFLVTFADARGGPFHLLIDCGVILGTPQPEEVMGKVARDIAATTGNHLQVVVATHEHWDHLSGFLQAKDVFDQMKIDEVWFAWTEDPADDLASRLREGRRVALQALRGLAGKLTGLNHAAAGHVESLLGFFGAAGGSTTRDALNYLAGHPSKPRLRYLRPAEPPLPLPGGDVRVFVLGPPHDERLIKRINPTRTGKEVYELTADADTAFLAAAGVLPGDAEDTGRLADLSQAFEPRFRLAPADAARFPLLQGYDDPKEKWRRIDGDWLNGADRLALNLDSDTNNTSLALALELRPGGGVLLFPGDAQVGNWESWQDCSWAAVGAGGAAVTGADLLRRTVLYKVGHHASHNATLRAKGLELMDSPDLVALIPVDHDMAVKKRWLGMPFPPLLARLQEKARGRVLRIDAGLPGRPAEVAQGLWDEFLGRVQQTPLYFDCTLPG
jgi:hypothetical protein